MKPVDTEVGILESYASIMRGSFSGTIKDIAGELGRSVIKSADSLLMPAVAGKGSVVIGTKVPGDCWIRKVLGFDGVAAARVILLCNVEETRGAENVAEVVRLTPVPGA
ncbi:hypothetical protein DPMN_136958 [Dreissena polymorpha]|uniref:Uncharacterized protein n=1 Tax=Dreissena polymorpha TaxID=45954 RepID=A0A9D4G4B5_DREPO|nr:hypothetical protein DPMN_136958 [Dreissena polymorpha]